MDHNLFYLHTAVFILSDLELSIITQQSELSPIKAAVEDEEVRAACSCAAVKWGRERVGVDLGDLEIVWRGRAIGKGVEEIRLVMVAAGVYGYIVTGCRCFEWGGKAGRVGWEGAAFECVVFLFEAEVGRGLEVFVADLEG